VTTGLSRPDRILVVAAHPDDEVLGCGGVIARQCKRDVDVRVIFLAEGITARYDPSRFKEARVVDEIRKRNDNATKALGLLGVKADEIYTESRLCCRLDQVPHIDLIKQIERHLDDFSPSHVLTHGANDTNIDHRQAHQAVISACRPTRTRNPSAILTFEVLSSTEWNPIPFPACVFADISDEIDIKVAALLAYDGEARPEPHPRSPGVIKSLAGYRGTQIGVRFAEAFGVIRQQWT
jgi:LmbE family N-acetylglucosaminyl deacetylase